MNIETIVVEKNGKYGPMVGGVYYSFSKFYKGNKVFPEGSSLDVDVYTSDSGKKYINSVVGEPVAEAKPVAKKAPNVEAQSISGIASGLVNSKTAVQTTDWAAKDRSQLVGGRSHDAAALVNTALVTGTDLDEVLKLYKKALEEVLTMAGEVK